MTGAAGFLVRVLVALVAVLLGSAAPVASMTLIPPETTHGFTYDAPAYNAPGTASASERGPPSVAVAHTAFDAAQAWSSGASTRSDVPTAPAITTYTTVTASVQVTEATTTTGWQVRLDEGSSSSFDDPGVAANTVAKGADDAPIAWPPNDGFHGASSVTVLKPGTQVDRFGYDGGRFVAPNGTPIGQRSLAPGTTDKPYSVFEVTMSTALEN